MGSNFPNDVGRFHIFSTNTRSACVTLEDFSTYLQRFYTNISDAISVTFCNSGSKKSWLVTFISPTSSASQTHLLAQTLTAWSQVYEQFPTQDCTSIPSSSVPNSFLGSLIRPTTLTNNRLRGSNSAGPHHHLNWDQLVPK